MSDAVYDAFLGAGNNLRQVVATRYSPNAVVIPAYQSGAVEPSEQYGGNAQQQVSFDTLDIAGVVGMVSMTSGLALSSDAITIPYQRRANASTFAGTLSHFTLSATDGVLTCSQISASQDNEGAVATLDFLPLSSDGFTNPLSEAKNQTLTASAFNAQFDFGPVYFNSVQVPQAVGWSVNPGVTLRSRRFDGTVYPTAHYIIRVLPSITIVFEEVDDVVDVFTNLWAGMTTAAVYARRRSDGSTHVADSTASHAKFSFATGITNLDSIQVNESASAQVSVTLFGKSLTASVASMIP